MVNYKGMAVITALDWVAENELRMYFTYHAFSDPDVNISSAIECFGGTQPNLIKEGIRGFIKAAYDAIPEPWDLLSDDFILLNNPS